MDCSPREAIDTALDWLASELGPAALVADGQDRQARRLGRVAQIIEEDRHSTVYAILEAMRMSRDLKPYEGSRAVILNISNAYCIAGHVGEPEDTDPAESTIYLNVQEAPVYRYARAAAAGARLLGVDDPVAVLVAEGTPVWRALSLCELLNLRRP